MGIRSKMLGVTACSYERERRAFLDAGVDEFIEKPLTPQKLASVLREIRNAWKKGGPNRRPIKLC